MSTVSRENDTNGSAVSELEQDRIKKTNPVNHMCLISVNYWVALLLLTVCSYPKGGIFTTKLHSEN
jgi:hypothetical protein